MKTYCSTLLLLTMTNAQELEFGRMLSAKGGKIHKQSSVVMDSKSAKVMSVGFDQLGLGDDFSMEYPAGKSEERGAKSTKMSMEFEHPFVLMRTKSHKNVFSGDFSGDEASDDTLSLDYIPLESKSAKEELFLAIDSSTGEEEDLSMIFLPFSSKSQKQSFTDDLSMEFVPISNGYKSGKTGKVTVGQESPALNTNSGKTGKLPVEESPADEPVINPKSSKNSIPISTRTITLGQDSELQVSEANSEKNGAEDARKMTAVSVMALGAMLFV